MRARLCVHAASVSSLIAMRALMTMRAFREWRVGKKAECWAQASESNMHAGQHRTRCYQTCMTKIKHATFSNYFPQLGPSRTADAHLLFTSGGARNGSGPRKQMPPL